MATTALTELQQQIEEVRRETFAAGYAAAMQAIRELASRPAPSRGMARGHAEPQAPATIPTRRRRVGTKQGTPRPRRSTAGLPERGANAQRVEEILRTSAPRALRMAEIRKELQGMGVEIPFTSIRPALSQLEKRNAAEQVGNSRTWRHRGGAS
jgi:hypothetical protein